MSELFGSPLVVKVIVTVSPSFADTCEEDKLYVTLSKSVCNPLSKNVLVIMGSDVVVLAVTTIRLKGLVIDIS